MEVRREVGDGGNPKLELELAGQVMQTERPGRRTAPWR